MNLPEEIQNEINKVKKLEGEISILLKKRTERSERGLSTTSEDAKLNFMIDNFIAILNGVKHKSGDIISGNKKLKDTINELEDIYRVFKRQIDKIASGSPLGKKLIQNYDLTDDRTYEDKNSKPQTYSDYQMYKERQLKEGDEVLEEISGRAKQIKKGAVMIRDEIDLHDPLLNDLEKNMSRVEGKMKRSENKLAKYLEKSSNSCLYYTILIELIFLLLLFVM